MKIDYQAICQELLSALPDRQKNVLSRRFGLNQKQTETLQSIGKDLNITRERVRQLEKSALLSLKNLSDNKNFKKIVEYFTQYLQVQGGQKREDLLLNELSDNSSKNCAYFLLSLSDNFYRFGENDELQPFWALSKEKEDVISSIVKKLKDIFYKEQKPVALEALKNMVEEDVLLLQSCLEISRSITQGPLGGYGLSSWPEIKPKGVRDVAYLVLKKQGQPLHFCLIAAKAGELPGEIFTKRKMLPQTIHNELIRDPRFVLVGRGIYGLDEWGYTSGTVKEVIYKILEASSPLDKEEILSAVQKQRVVKPNTVFLGLSDKQKFSRNTEGKYTLAIKTA